ncbi:hypothetical protein [Marinoscillum pacificum]|uniref:hypothetical protein n=1 Tax=Marinoscillum pacificum TaxID=392723 RepID=UPI0021589940|nr:hypothetical protein [Marinoscillum pacificum]
MRKFLAMSLFLSGALVFTSCSEDDAPSDAEVQQAALDQVSAAVDGIVSTDASASGADESVFGWTLTMGGTYNSTATERVDVEGNISADVTWTADKIYEINKRVTVLDGVTLTIEPGTRIEGDVQFTGADASVLMIARGGKIMAEGTAELPIIMTTTDDDGTLTAADKGKWGGLVVLGKASISAEQAEVQIEGVDASDVNGLYGGTADNDNSGVIKYVSIRHGGAVIDAAAGDEINGLTLGGVGTGTTIQNVEIFANSDDGVEFFGGSVNVTNILVAQVGDDAIDIDQSYKGKVTNYYVTVDEDSDEGLEIDGREGDALGSFTLVNGTIKAVAGSVTCDFKSKAQGTVTNLNANGGRIKLDASFDEVTFESTENAAQNVIDGKLNFSTVNAEWSVYTDDLPALIEE